ncbi:hypothetical protein FOZ61_001266 [Perkinsus olseni]|uniref:RAP domain-containing protein n=1 Tax=Perkinsus olseni TaxID=32597 RepID=A0A7J6LXP5_PEROL|nr:hypothetical protein FOZ61_001266 [Perkinsus olseni]
MSSEDAIACMKALSYLPTSDAPQEAHIQLLRIIYPFINPYTRDRSMDTVISEVESILHTLAHVQSKTLVSKHLSKDNNTLVQRLICRLIDANDSREVSISNILNLRRSVRILKNKDMLARLDDVMVKKLSVSLNDNNQNQQQQQQQYRGITAESAVAAIEWILLRPTGLDHPGIHRLLEGTVAELTPRIRELTLHDIGLLIETLSAVYSRMVTPEKGIDKRLIPYAAKILDSMQHKVLANLSALPHHHLASVLTIYLTSIVNDRNGIINTLPTTTSVMTITPIPELMPAMLHTIRSRGKELSLSSLVEVLSTLGYSADGSDDDDSGGGSDGYTIVRLLVDLLNVLSRQRHFPPKFITAVEELINITSTTTSSSSTTYNSINDMTTNDWIRAFQIHLCAAVEGPPAVRKYLTQNADVKAFFADNTSFVWYASQERDRTNFLHSDTSLQLSEAVTALGWPLTLGNQLGEVYHLDMMTSPTSSSLSHDPSTMLDASLNYEQAGKRAAIVCIKEEDELRWYTPITKGADYHQQTSADDHHNIANVRLGHTRVMIGDSLTKVRHLHSLGWKVIPVWLSEWSELQSVEERRRYLVERAQEAYAVGPATTDVFTSPIRQFNEA